MKQIQGEINEFPKRGAKFLRRLQAEKKIDLSVDYGRSFSFVESKLVSLQEANPGSLIKLQTVSVSLDSQCEAEQRFYRLAIILAASVDIAKYCKPVISFDSGALKHVCWPGYQVMVMGMQDGEKRDVLVGIAIVPTESEEHYIWFMQFMKQNIVLRDDVLGQPDLVVITDRSKGLINAVSKELPNAHHRYCSLHLMGNIKSPAFSDEQKSLYWRVVKSKSKQEFECYMRELQCSHNNAYNYLKDLNETCWVDYAQPVSSWGLYANNLAERAVKAIGSDCDGGRRLCPMQIISRFVDHQSKKLNEIREKIEESVDRGGLGLTGRACSIHEEIWVAAQSCIVAKPVAVQQTVSDCTILSYDVHKPSYDLRTGPTGYEHQLQLDEDR